MSSKIDERVVAMKIDHSQFMRGTEETVSALDRLKDALNFDSVESSLDKTSTNFDIFGAVAFSAIHKLVGGAIDAGAKIGAAMWEPLVEGGRKRALNLEQARFQFKNLGVDVVAVMADVDYAVSGTAYSLDAAASAAASLSASQVALGDEMKAALRGISGVAALTGSSYEDISDVFTKVAGQGRLMGDDLNRLSSRGMNAAATLAEAFGTTEVEIRDMVSKGKISFDDFAKAMDNAFGAKASAANETYSGALSNLRSSLSRIGALYFEGRVDLTTGEQVFSGELERQRDLFNALRPRINEIKDALTPLFHVYSDIAKIRNDNLIELIGTAGKFGTVTNILNDFSNATPHIANGIRNLWDAFNAIMDPIKEAWKVVFPSKVSTIITKIASAFNKFTRTLIIGADGAARIRGVFVLFFSALKTGINIIKGVLSVVGTVVGLIFRLGGAILGLLTPIVTFFSTFAKGAEDSSIETKGFFDAINNFLKGGLEPLIDFISNLGSKFNEFLNNGDMFARVKNFGDLLRDLGGVIAMIWNVLAKGDFTSNAFFSEDSTFVDILFKIRDGIIAVVNAFKDFGGLLKNAAAESGGFWGGVLNILKTVWTFIKDTVSGIKDFFKTSFDSIDWDAVLAGINAGFLVGAAVGIGKLIKSFTNVTGAVGDIKQSFIDTIDELKGAFSRLAKETPADKLIKIAAALIILAGALWILSSIDPNRLQVAVMAMAISFGILLAGLAVLDQIDAEPSMKASVAITLIAFAINIMASAVAKLAALDPEQLAGGMLAVVALMLLMVVAAERISDIEKDMLKAAAALIAMAFALNMLIVPVLALAFIPAEALSQGLGSVGLLLAGLTLAAQWLGKASDKMPLAALGMMAMAAALNMLVVPIITLGLLPMGVLSQGMTALGLALVAMAIVMSYLGSVGPMVAVGTLALVAMALALNMLVIPIVTLGLLPFDALVQGMTALGYALVAMAIIMTFLGTVAPMVAVGTLALIAMAIALNLLIFPILTLGALPFEYIFQAILNITALLLGMGIMAMMMIPFLPVIVLFSAAMGFFGLAMIGISGAMMIFSLALFMLGPAIMVATQGLLMFAASSPKLMKAVEPMIALGIALALFGGAAILAGIGASSLGIGLILLGVGLALVAAIGMVGAFALTKVVEAMMKLLVHIPGMLALGGTFIILGAGIAVLGVGLAVLAVAAVLVLIAFGAMIPMGALLMASFALITKAIERLVPMSDKIATIGKAMGKLGDATVKLATSGRTAASGLNAINVNLSLLSVNSMMASTSLKVMAVQIGSSMTIMRMHLSTGAVGFQKFATAVITSITFMNSALAIGFSQASITVKVFSVSLGGTLVTGIRASNVPVFNASVTLGSQITSGMNRGLQNGSYLVAQMASRVAQNALIAAKKTLGVASPSKEFEWIGEMSDDGLAKGLLNNIRTVENAGTQTGKAALSAVQKALMDAKNAVAMEMNLQPTIRPVLDLSEVQKSAAGLNGMLRTPTLTVTDSYAKAAYISSARRADEIEASSNDTDVVGKQVNFTQNNYSPKALSTSEIYRNSKNAISLIKKEAPV